VFSLSLRVAGSNRAQCPRQPSLPHLIRRRLFFPPKLFQTTLTHNTTYSAHPRRTLTYYNKPTHTTTTRHALPFLLLRTVTSHTTTKMSSINNNSPAYTTSTSFVKTYTWRCADAKCEQINETQRGENSNWYNSKCTACSAVPGKGACLLQIELLVDNEKVDWAPRSSYYDGLEREGGV
jgi:hypothetical protein